MRSKAIIATLRTPLSSLQSLAGRFLPALLLTQGLALSGCGYLKDIAELDREVAFSVSINPSQIYEGQQAMVEVRLLKAYSDAKSVSWKINQADGATATASEFVETQGSVSISGQTAQTFQITSKPGSVTSGVKEYQLILSSEGFSQTFSLAVKDSGTSNTISITATDNSGFVNLANKSSYNVSGVCSTNGSDVSLTAEINGASVSGTTPCTGLAWTIPLDFSGVAAEGAVTLSATHAGGAGSIAATTLQIQKDTVKPTVAVSTPAAMSFVNASSASSFTLIGSCSELTRVVSATLTSSGGGTPVIASGLCLNIMGSGAWSTTANISSLNDGTITASINHADSAGNSESAVRAFTKDTLIPTLAITSPLSLAIYNASNYQTLAVSGTCNKNGATVTLTGDVSGTLTATCNGSTYSLAGLTLTGANGIRSVTATISDSAGNQTQASISLHKDILVPTLAITSPASMTMYNASNYQALAINGTCNKSGATVTLTGDVSGTLSANCDGTNFAFSGLTLTGAAGTRSITATIADSAGNQSQTTLSLQKDILVPTLTIASPASLTTYNASNYQSLAVSGACNKAGATVTLTGDVSGTLTATCDGANYSLTGLTLTGTDGIRLVTATISDSAGNQTQASVSLQKNILVPMLAISSPASMTMYNASNYQALAITGTCNKSGATVTLTGDVSGTLSANCNGTNFSFSGLTLTGANGTRSITATIADSAGNQSQTTLSLQKDILVPTLAISSPASLSIYNSSTYQALAITGTCNKASATVTLTGDVSGTLTAICDGTNFSLSSLTVTGADGVKSITATIVDSASNQSQTTLSLQKDTLVPTSVLSGAPASFSNQTSLNVTVGGSNVSQYMYKVGVAASTDCTVATGYSAAIGIATPITDALGADGAKKLCVLGINPNGNTQAMTSATTVSWTKDTVVPVVTIASPAAGSYVNRLAQTSFAVSGTCTEVGAGNVIITGHATATANCVAGSPNTWSANVDLSSAADGPVFLLVSQTDAAGNVGSVARTFNKETVDPTIAYSSPAGGSYVNNANKAAFAVSGDCSDYSATPNIALTSSALTSTVNAACDGAHWTAILAFNNGDENVTVQATITDAAGNTASTTRSFTKDTTNPTLAISSPAAGSYVNNANKVAFAISGTCTDVGTNNVAITGSATATIDCVAGSPNTWSTNLNFTAASDGAVSVDVKLTDAAGNTHTVTRGFNKDVVAPVTGWTLPLASACASNSSGTTFAVAGTCTTADGSVTLSSAQLAVPVATSCTGGAWSTTLNLDVTALADLASFDVQTAQTDTAGNSTSSTRSFKKIGSAPTVILGGWTDIYAVGVKTYADGRSSEPGTVRIAWNNWPGTNTCQPDAVKVYRATSSGGAFSIVSNTDYPSGIPANVKTFTDTTLAGATAGTVGSPTDFNKGWYYRLKVTIAGTDYDVTSPAQIAEVRVVAPPDNMGLMHRWIANQEVCGLMGRATDETSNYRCSYSGWGKIVGNYYDMQTDMLVDRNELGCNYSSNCGAGGNQLCVATSFSNQSNPSAGAGIIAPLDAVYYDNANTATCYLKTAAGDTNWTQATSLSTSAQRLAVSTPKAHVPPLVNVSQNSSYPICQANSVTLTQFPADTFPKNKRLLRQKEWRAAVAWSPDLNYTGAGYANIDTFIRDIETGGTGRTGYCNSSNAHNGINDNRRAPDTPFAYPFAVFETGSHVATIQCQSRYGLQDMVGNVWEWTSDQLGGCTALGDGCAGVTSALDASNADMNGFRFDGINEGPNAGNEWYIQNQNYSATYFSLALGLPMLNSDSGNAIAISSWTSPTNKFHDDYFWLYPGNGNVSRGLIVGGDWGNGGIYGRWSAFWYSNPGGANNSVGLRCGVPLQY